MVDDDDPFIAENLRQAHAVLIRYPHFKELHQDIKQCQQLSKISGEPQCMSLEGVSGAGKSTLVKEYAKAFPRIDTPERTLIPVFYVQTPSPVSIGGMASTMLERLGDLAPDRGKVPALNRRLVKLIIASKIQLVILDDFHHLIDSKTNRILEAVSDWLKVLIKETEVPFLVVGIEGQVERILKANSQLSRLFPVRETLQPFHWDMRNLSTVREFAQFINLAETAIDIPLTKQIGRIELLFRIHYVTDGVVANIMNLLRSAQLYTIKRGCSSIELSDLSAAFTKHLAKHVYTKINPFIGENKFIVPAEAEEDKDNLDKEVKKKTKKSVKSKSRENS